MAQCAVMVVFRVVDSTWPIDDRTAEHVATALRVEARGARVSTHDPRVKLADRIESALVGDTPGPIDVDEHAAEALFRHLNAVIRNPDAVDPAYGLYLELRRVLGRLYA